MLWKDACIPNRDVDKFRSDCLGDDPWSPKVEVGGNNGVVGHPSLGREVENSATCGTPGGIYRLQKEPRDSNQRLFSSPSFLPVDDGQ